MRKLTFKVSSKKDIEITSLIKEINKISCRIHLDMGNNLVTVENVNDTMIDDIIDLVDNYYTILGVDVDNTSAVASEGQEIPVVTEFAQEPAETGIVSADSEEKVEKAVPKKEPEVLEPQSADDLIIKKIEFENEYVENIINKLMKTFYWAMYKMNVSEKEIGNFIYTCLNEISMKYNKDEWSKEFSVGDIVVCNYGTHLPGEINGGNIHGIVCNILDENMVYVVPITKVTEEELTSKSYLIYSAPEDAEYKSDRYTGGIALLEKGKYIHIARVNYVIGKTTESFFSKLLNKLASTFDFTTYKDMLSEKVEDISPIFEESNETDEQKSPNNMVNGEESALIEIVGPALKKINKLDPISKQITDFLNEIGMSTTDTDFITQSFIIACNVNRISYASVLSKLHEKMPYLTALTIKQTLQKHFKNWLKNYPELAKKCPKISLMSLLKVFAKRFDYDFNC